MRIDLSAVQADAWVECRTQTLAGYTQEVLRAAAREGVPLTALGDPDDPARAALVPAHQLALIHWQVQAWHVRNADGALLPAPRDVTADDLALVAQPVFAALLAAIDEARRDDEPQDLGPNGSTPSSAR
jgi:hypothetical protein